MNRREFIKISALITPSIFLDVVNLQHIFARPPRVQAGIRRFKGTRDGHVLISVDEGRTWQLHSHFSDGVSIEEMTVDHSGSVHIYAGYSGFRFSIKLAADDLHWVPV